MWFKIKTNVIFFCRSFHLHGVHSPFVYQLSRECFGDKKKYGFYEKLRVFKDFLLKNDLEGSLVSFKNAKLLYRLIDYLKIETVLELGFHEGLETYAIVSANTTCLQVATDCTVPVATEKYFGESEAKKIEWIKTAPMDFLKNMENRKYDLVFFHKATSPKIIFSQFEKALCFGHKDSVFIFEKIHSSKENEQLWEQIKQHPTVKVTVDTFDLGLVFFRKEQAKEHFVIRA